MDKEINMILKIIEILKGPDITGDLENVEKIANFVIWLAKIITLNIPLALLILLILKIIDKNK